MMGKCILYMDMSMHQLNVILIKYYDDLRTHRQEPPFNLKNRVDLLISAYTISDPVWPSSSKSKGSRDRRFFF